MSNQSVGTVYQQIIREVVESSRVDFEEGGVDESVLDELARAWQQKLSGLNVAQFPWDPKPEPVPDMSYPQHQMPPQQIHAQQQYGMPPQQGQAPQYPQPPQMQPMQQQQQTRYNSNAGGVRIKTEPGLENSAPPPQPMSYGGMPNANTAAQRAAQNLANQYGPRAQASINAMNVGMPQQGQQQQYQQPPQMQQQQPQRPPGPPIPRPSMTPSQYQQAMAQQAAQQKAALQQTNPSAQYPQTYAQQGQQQAQQNQAPQQAQGQQSAQNQQQPGQYQPPSQNQNQNPNNQNNQGGNNSATGNGIVKAQVDGGAESDDEDRHAHFGVVKTKGPDGQIIESQVEIDGMLRRQIEARGKAMEGGGLMMPMKEHNKRAAERKADKQKGRADKRARKVKLEVAAQMDAADDSDEEKIKEEDEDAINSDLDDPDEPVDDEDDDEETQWVMLCMYDKVQRVKNKWKCVMKDGVLTINGKDYVFHKASGEYEW